MNFKYVGYHSNFNFECNTERGSIESLSIALGGLRLFFFSNFPRATFIQEAMSILDSRVREANLTVLIYIPCS